MRKLYVTTLICFAFTIGPTFCQLSKVVRQVKCQEKETVLSSIKPEFDNESFQCGVHVLIKERAEVSFRTHGCIQGIWSRPVPATGSPAGYFVIDKVVP
jgi:hypothetical protein